MGEEAWVTLAIFVAWLAVVAVIISVNRTFSPRRDAERQEQLLRREIEVVIAEAEMLIRCCEECGHAADRHHHPHLRHGTYCTHGNCSCKSYR